MKTFFKKIVVYILRAEAKIVLRKYRPKVVAITGSHGKTSTKDAVYAVLSRVTYVRKTVKNDDNEIGLPLTILGLPERGESVAKWLLNLLRGLWLIVYPSKYPKWLVLEVGVRKPGDMQKIATWLKSDVVIETGIGETPTHIEFFHSRKKLIEEKSELILTLKKGGHLILNKDDEDVMAMQDKTKNLITTFGFSEDSDIRASNDDIYYDQSSVPAGVNFRIDESGRSLPVFLSGVFGKNYIYAALGALAFAKAFKINILEAINALAEYEASPGRMRLLQGIEDSYIIDDSYNSSPTACQAAISTLGSIMSKGKKIAILGDMLELGRHTTDAHLEIGKLAAEHVDLLVLVGHRAKFMKDGAIAAGLSDKKIFEFLDSVEASQYVPEMIKRNDIVLVKGSQVVRMEKIVSEIMLDTNNKNKLLVRQGREWQEKK